MEKNINLFDTSNYNKTHELYDKTNNKVIGKFKNESTEQITEFVGLRSKLYAYKTDDNEDHKKCKGVKRNVIANNIKFENYKNTLYTRQAFNIKQNTFRSYKHVIYTETIEKVGLSAEDDKCYIQNDNINTYTLGHYKIKK